MNVCISNMKRAAQQRENERMEAMEAEAAPLLYAMLAVVLAMALWPFVSDFISRAEIKQDAQITSAILAQCANGNVVRFGDAMMMCTVKELVK
jgi:hypothetical protein